MCAAPPAQLVASYKPTSASPTASNPTSAPNVDPNNLLQRLVLGGLGSFQQRVREAGLQTTVTPRPIGTIDDPTRRM